MLNHERLTIKAAEAIQTGVAEATRRGNPTLEDLHLLDALLGQEETVVIPILQKVGVNIARLEASLQEGLGRLPKQSGGSAPTMSRELNNVFAAAEEFARAFKDEYTSTEHLLMALAAQKGSSTRDLLSQQGATAGTAA